MYVATAALCACGGCHCSLMTVGEPLIALLAENSISYSSHFVDQRTISPSDVVLVTGGIRNSEEMEIASEIGRTSRKVIAVGTCAVYGGIPGARDVVPVELEEGSGLPLLLPRLLPLDAAVPVELYVPGCPPPPNLIFEALKSVIEGYSSIRFDSTVCSDCPRQVRRGPVRRWTLHPGTGVHGADCLLNDGMLCLGPVTRGGCRASCPARGAACAGCRGPSDTILSSQLHSMYADMVKFVGLTCGLREDKVEKEIAVLLPQIYLFTRRDPVTRARIREKVSDG